MAQTTDVLAANGGNGRLRIGILLTDGESAYEQSQTSRAAAAGVTIYTLARGAGADTALLGRIAAGTGGSAFTIDQADRLAALYEQLARHIIDDGTDADGDGLTDCEERNGLFSPVNVFLPNQGVNSPLDDFGEFTFPSPDTAQSADDVFHPGPWPPDRTDSDNDGLLPSQCSHQRGHRSLRARDRISRPPESITGNTSLPLAPFHLLSLR